jgi:hypothetical protein
MLKAVILYFLMVLLHPVHVTLTSIDQAPGSDTLKVFFRMYYDDFLVDYRLYDPDFRTAEKQEDNVIPDEMINRYFNDRVNIYINNRLLQGKLTDISKDDFEICLTVLYRSDAKPRKLKIKHEVLTRVYNDQANMVYININRYQEALKLTCEQFSEKRNLEGVL